MLIRMLANADGIVQGVTTALFVGQTYDVDDAERLLAAGAAERAGDGLIPAEKAISGPPEDKVIKPRVRRNK